MVYQCCTVFFFFQVGIPLCIIMKRTELFTSQWHFMHYSYIHVLRWATVKGFGITHGATSVIL